MPEAILPVRDMIRLRADVVNVNETNLQQMFTAEIVRMVSEILNAAEFDGYDVAWGWSITDRINTPEIPLYALGAAITDVIVEIIDETTNYVETVGWVTVQQIEEAITKAVNEIVSATETLLHAGNLTWVRTEVLQIREDAFDELNVFFFKVIDESVNVSETTGHALAQVGVKVVEIVSEIFNTLESKTIYRKIVRFGGRELDRYTDGFINMAETSIGLAYIIGQIVGNFSIGAAIKGWFMINKDLDQ